VLHEPAEALSTTPARGLPSCSRSARERPSRGRPPRPIGGLERFDGMSETSDRLLQGYQAQEKRFLERRFPLRLASENPTLRELYRQAKRFRWNSETDIAWSRFDPAAYPPPVREAARLVWSRRAWGTYPRARREHRAPDPLLPRVRRGRHGRQAVPVLSSRGGGQAARGVLPLRATPGRLRVDSRSPRWRSIPTCRWSRW
jgi:hypothetical protein